MILLLMLGVCVRATDSDDDYVAPFCTTHIISVSLQAVVVVSFWHQLVPGFCSVSSLELQEETSVSFKTKTHRQKRQ